MFYILTYIIIIGLLESYGAGIKHWSNDPLTEYYNISAAVYGMATVQQIKVSLGVFQWASMLELSYHIENYA